MRNERRYEWYNEQRNKRRKEWRNKLQNELFNVLLVELRNMLIQQVMKRRKTIVLKSLLILYQAPPGSLRRTQMRYIRVGTWMCGWVRWFGGRGVFNSFGKIHQENNFFSATSGKSERGC